MKWKKRWAAIGLIGVLLIVLIANIDTSKETVIYHVPEGFKGCMTIYFSQKGYEPLDMKDNEIIIDIPKDGKVITSTSQEDFNKIGWHKTEAYYLNNSGERIMEIPKSMYQNGLDSITNSDPKSARFTISFDGRSDYCY
ncbi:DUF6843 domain-containing protein [Chungangia koreensis]|uniref:DUF6843 domain-containing protein n=1 Tax=Chungangia koreensis TaxID=752657 RepID=A0ABV8X2W3_9LACT